MQNPFQHQFKPKRKYTQAYKDPEVVAEVLNAFKEKKLNLIQISEYSHVPYNIVKYWHKKYKLNHKYVPGKDIGQHRRIFSPDIEKNIAEFIKLQFIEAKVMIRRKHLRKILYNAWQSLDPQNRSQLVDDRFISKTFLKSFCRRNGLSFRMMRKKKRSEINEKEVSRYTNEILKAIKEYDKGLIFNMDETPWNFVYRRGKVLAYRSIEEVNAELPEDIKKQFTVISTISSNGEKNSPIFLANGTTNRCHQQFGDMKSNEEEYIVYHSASGKTDDAVMIFYLKQLKTWAQNKECVLVLDQYPSHISDSTKDFAAEQHIQLIYIPVSGTDIYQPLDKYIFGILKSQASSIIDDKSFEFQIALTKSEAADLFVSLWNDLKVRHVIKAWNTALPEEQNSSNSTVEQTKEENEKDDLDDDYFPASESQSETDSSSNDYSSDDDTLVGRRHHMKNARH